MTTNQYSQPTVQVSTQQVSQGFSIKTIQRFLSDARAYFDLPPAAEGDEVAYMQGAMQRLALRITVLREFQKTEYQGSALA